MDELLARHRKEQRDLQSRATQKKKQASKKTRKGVHEECERLEVDLREKQAAEVAAVDGNALSTAVDDALLHEELDNPNVEEDAVATDETVENGVSVRQDTSATTHVASDEAIVPSQLRKGNRQKARLARRAAEQEEAAQQAAEEAKDLPDLKQQERERMLEAMKSRGLREKEIRADGHCLYSAVADQLEHLHIPLGSAPAGEKPGVGYQAVRAAAADYIDQHQDDFVPFLEEPLPIYLHKIRATGEWGGQLELMALAKTLGMDINVLQDFGRVEKIESGVPVKKDEMWLGYYKHGFGLGEHYNSLRKTP